MCHYITLWITCQLQPETNILFNNKFNLLQVTTFWLICVTEYPNCPPVASMQAWRPASLVNGLVNNALFHSSPYINQMLPQIVHILHFFGSLICLRLCSQLDWGHGCLVARNLDVHRCGHDHCQGECSEWCTKC